MIDSLRKALLTGVGLAALTAEKAKEIAQDFKEQGKLTEEEGKILAQELLEKSAESRKEVEGYTEEIVKKILSSMNLATKSEIDELKAQIESLEERLAGE